MRMNVYVDAFNLYYGAVKDTPYRWLDLDALCRRLFPRDEINRIRYFTAIVSRSDSRPTCVRCERSRTCRFTAAIT